MSKESTDIPQSTPPSVPPLGKEEATVTSISSLDQVKESKVSSPLPVEVQNNVFALRQVTLCHNLIRDGKFSYEAFGAVHQATDFLQKLHSDLAEQIVKCPEAETHPDLAILFENKRKREAQAEALEKAAKTAEKAQKDQATVTSISSTPSTPSGDEPNATA